MALDSLRELAEDVGDLVDGVTAAQAQVATALQTGTVTTQQIRGLRASVAGLQADAREVRGALDPVDVRDYLTHERGADVIGLWTWERESRHQLLVVEQRLREVDEAAEDLEFGARQRVRVVRSGDTWQSLAQELLGDWREWARLVEANGLDYDSLDSGTVLVIPERR